VPKRYRKIYLLAAIFLIATLAIVASIEYLSYTQTLTLQPYKQFALGVSSASWTIYINDINQVQYVPGGDSQPTLNIGDTSTYAFNITTDANRVCSLEIQLASAVSGTDFSEFQVTVLSNSTLGWTAAPLYTAATGTTTTSYLDGLTSGSAVYIHQPVSTSTYYLVAVTYSYIAGTTTPISVSLQYTPLPLTSF